MSGAGEGDGDDEDCEQELPDEEGQIRLFGPEDFQPVFKLVEVKHLFYTIIYNSELTELKPS